MPIDDPAAFVLSDFDFELPPESIAQHPAHERTASRLLHVSGSTITDLTFTALPDLLVAGDVMVFNDTRVIRSRLHARKAAPHGGKVELLLERIMAPDEAWLQFKASHPPRTGARIELPGGASATVLERDGRFVRLRFAIDTPLEDYLDRHGHVPLPPYITRAPESADEERYQTVYARHAGAVAAPTAGLHFDGAMLNKLSASGIVLAYITLHVGAGTFESVDDEDLSRHRMHSERFSIPPATIAAIEAARSAGRSVIAVGTTSLRALESSASEGLRAGDAETSLFITPGYRFQVVDRLLTNFHLPRSTLLMLVSAFGGYHAIRAAYRHAIDQRYRFFSYGDAMLLERDRGCGPGRNCSAERTRAASK
jgi:S-adenosylmethionine:tRNA ribosyltransferase-isomerase